MTRTILAASAAFGLALSLSPAAQASGPWTGIYLGGHAGGIWGDIDAAKTAQTGGGFLFDPVPPVTSQTFSADGILGGVQLGYLYQFDNFVVGLEVSGSYADFDQTKIELADTDNVRTVSSDWNAAATLRAGYAFGTSLAYLKGGYALARIEHELVDSNPPTGTYSTSENHDGWTAGVGFEQMISSDMSVGVEYDYYDFGPQDHVATIGADSVTRSYEATVHTVSARLNWHFNP